MLFCSQPVVSSKHPTHTSRLLMTPDESFSVKSTALGQLEKSCSVNTARVICCKSNPEWSHFCVMSFPAQVLYSYSIGFVYILTGLLCVGGLGPAVAFCSEVRISQKYSQNGQSLDDRSAHVSDTSRCFTSSKWMPPLYCFSISWHCSFDSPALSASREDLRLCLLLLAHGLFWHFLRLGLDQAVRRPGCSDGWVQPLAPWWHHQFILT